MGIPRSDSKAQDRAGFQKPWVCRILMLTCLLGPNYAQKPGTFSQSVHGLHVLDAGSEKFKSPKPYLLPAKPSSPKQQATLP